MKKHIVIISIAIGLFSCKISKQTTADIQTTTVEQKEVSTKTNETKSDNSTIGIDVNEEVTITVFSQPDSLGKQYVTSVMEIKKNKTVSGKKNIVEEKGTVKQEDSNVHKLENTKVTEKSKTTTKTAWVPLVFGCIFLLGLIFVCWYYFFGYKKIGK